MNIRKLIGLTAFACAFGAQAATELYVDVNDPNASDEACEGRGTAALPYRTIQAAIDASVADDTVDTVKVKPGIYSEGSSKAATGNPDQLHRVVVKKNLHLVSTGGAAVTEIRGQLDTTAHPYIGASAVRCVYVEPTASGAIVEGFTLGNGATRNDHGDIRNSTKACYGGAFYAPGGGYLVDSVVTNSFAIFGGGISGGTAVRCLVSHCGGPYWDSASADRANLWNCVVYHDYFSAANSSSQKSLTYVTNVNCTVVNNNFNYADFYNCQSYNLLSVAFAKSETVSGESYNCVYRKNGYGLTHCVNPLVGDYRLLSTSTAIGVGDASYLESVIALPSSIARTDFYGSDLTGLTGAIAAGASQTIGAPRYGGVKFSEKTPFVNGVKIPLGGYLYAETWPVRWEITLPGYNVLYFSGPGPRNIATRDGKHYFIPSPTPGELASLWPCCATAVIWTDPENGSDETGDGTEANPYRTLQKAADERTYAKVGYAYTIVNAKKGRYDEGGRVVEGVFTRLIAQNGTSNPMLIRAVDGPGETFLVGATNATDLCRCADLNDGVILQGFTLTDGRTGSDSSANYAVTLNGTLTDCVVSNCTAAGRLCSNCTVQRTRFVCNTAGDVIYYGMPTWAFCTFSGNVTGGSIISGAGNPIIFNCSFAGNDVGTSPLIGSDHVYPNNCLFDANGCKYTPSKNAASAGTSLLWNYTTGSTLPDNLIIADPQLADAATHGLHLGAMSGAIFAGDLSGAVEKMANATYWMMADVDGNPVAFDANGKTHLGAVHTGIVPVCTIAAPYDGLAVAGGSIGTNFVKGDPVAFSVSAASVSRNAIGLAVTDAAGNVTTNLFADLPQNTWTHTVSDVASSVSVTAVYATDWYVDPVNGDDANDGFTLATAKRTLADVSTNALLIAGDVIHARPGTYDAGVIRSSAKSRTFVRAVIPAGVTLVADEGKDVTTIKGAASSSPSVTDGSGVDATRAAELGAGAKLVGFTISGARSYHDWNSDWPADCAAGVRGADLTAEVVDCLFTDCRGYISCGASATFNRCRARGCGTTQNSAVRYQFDSAVLKNCLVADSNQGGVVSSCSAYNSTLVPYPGWHCVTGGGTYCNSIVYGFAKSTPYYYGCIIATNKTYATWNESAIHFNPAHAIDSVITNVEAVALSSAWKSASAASLPVDAGLGAYLAADFDESTTDLAGAPRVMNYDVDVGAYEWDIRPEMKSALGGRIGSVAWVSSNAVVTAGNKVMLDGDGATLTAVKQGDSPLATYVTFADGGTLTALVNGVAVATTAKDGLFQIGEMKDGDKVTLVYEGDGSVTFGKLTSGIGLIIIFR